MNHATCVFCGATDDHYAEQCPSRVREFHAWWPSDQTRDLDRRVAELEHRLRALQAVLDSHLEDHP